ncbi:MAG: hypothetical protein ACAH11_13655 [Sphingomonas sp.]
MKPLVTLALMLALAGCGPQPVDPNRVGKGKGADAAADGGNAVAVDPAGTVPAAYQNFPAEVRGSIYQWDLLNQKCSGRFHPRDEAACTARDTLSKDLLAKGWCFGGSDEPATQHWLLCAEDYPGGEGWIASPKDADTLPPAQ